MPRKLRGTPALPHYPPLNPLPFVAATKKLILKTIVTDGAPPERSSGVSVLFDRHDLQYSFRASVIPPPFLDSDVMEPASVTLFEKAPPYTVQKNQHLSHSLDISPLVTFRFSSAQHDSLDLPHRITARSRKLFHFVHKISPFHVPGLRSASTGLHWRVSKSSLGIGHRGDEV